MFIDDYRDIHGPISDFGRSAGYCRLPLPSPGRRMQSNRRWGTYYVHAAITRNPDLASDRAKRDARLRLEIQRVWDDNYEVYAFAKSGDRCNGRALISRVALYHG